MPYTIVDMLFHGRKINSMLSNHHDAYIGKEMLCFFTTIHNNMALH